MFSLLLQNPNLGKNLLPSVLNKLNKSAVGASDQMVVNIPSFSNVQLANQNLSISLPGMSNSITPNTNTVMTMNSSSCKLHFFCRVLGP